MFSMVLKVLIFYFYCCNVICGAPTIVKVKGLRWDEIFDMPIEDSIRETLSSMNLSIFFSSFSISKHARLTFTRFSIFTILMHEWLLCGILFNSKIFFVRHCAPKDIPKKGVNSHPTLCWLLPTRIVWDHLVYFYCRLGDVNNRFQRDA